MPQFLVRIEGIRLLEKPHGFQIRHRPRTLRRKEMLARRRLMRYGRYSLDYAIREKFALRRLSPRYLSSLYMRHQFLEHGLEINRLLRAP